MNDPMFYYPPYPYSGEMMEEYYVDEERASSQKLFTPENALMYGNAVKSEYLPYKNYKVRKLTANNEKEALFLNMIAYENISHDIQLLLDNDPNNKELLKDHMKYCKEYEKTKKRYEERFEAICPCSDNHPDDKYDYLYVQSPWIRRGL